MYVIDRAKLKSPKIAYNLGLYVYNYGECGKIQQFLKKIKLYIL